jgi:hypothetical protein
MVLVLRLRPEYLDLPAVRTCQGIRQPYKLHSQFPILRPQSRMLAPYIQRQKPQLRCNLPQRFKQILHRSDFFQFYGQLEGLERHSSRLHRWAIQCPFES